MKINLIKKLMVFIVLVLAFAVSFNTQAASLNDYSENKIVDHVFRGTAYSETVQASFYVVLFTTSCTDAAVGTEVTGGSCARVAVALPTGAQDIVLERLLCTSSRCTITSRMEWNAE